MRDQMEGVCDEGCWGAPCDQSITGILPPCLWASSSHFARLLVPMCVCVSVCLCVLRRVCACARVLLLQPSCVLSGSAGERVTVTLTHRTTRRIPCVRCAHVRVNEVCGALYEYVASVNEMCVYRAPHRVQRRVTACGSRLSRGGRAWPRRRHAEEHTGGARRGTRMEGILIMFIYISSFSPTKIPMTSSCVYSCPSRRPSAPALQSTDGAMKSYPKGSKPIKCGGERKCP